MNTEEHTPISSSRNQRFLQTSLTVLALLWVAATTIAYLVRFSYEVYRADGEAIAAFFQRWFG